MKKTTKQIEQKLLKVLLNDNDFFNISELVRKTGMCHKTISNHLPYVYSYITHGYGCFHWMKENVVDFKLKD
jgi:hypothetical protein